MCPALFRGDDAVNNIDTKGRGLSATFRYFGVSQEVLDGKIAPETTVKRQSWFNEVERFTINSFMLDQGMLHVETG